MQHDEYSNLIALVSNTIDAFTAAVFVFKNEDKSDLIIHTIHTLSNNVNKGVEIKPGYGPIGWVAKSGQALNVSDFKRDVKTFMLYLSNESIKSFLAVPLVAYAEVLGVLMVDSKRKFAFSNKEQKILHQFATQFTFLLRRERVIDFSRAQKDVLKKTAHLLQTITAITDKADLLEVLEEELTVLIPCDSLVVTVRERSALYKYKVIVATNIHPQKVRIGFPYSMDMGLAGWIYRHETPLYLKNLRQERAKSYVIIPHEVPWELGSFIGAPIKVKGEVMGTISMGSKEKNRFTEKDFIVLKIVSCSITACAFFLANLC